MVGPHPAVAQVRSAVRPALAASDAAGARRLQRGSGLPRAGRRRRLRGAARRRPGRRGHRRPRPAAGFRRPGRGDGGAAAADLGLDPVVVVRVGRRAARRAGGAPPAPPATPRCGRRPREQRRPRRARPHPRRPGRDRAARPRPRVRARARWPGWSSADRRRRHLLAPAARHPPGRPRAPPAPRSSCRSGTTRGTPTRAYTRVRLRTEVLPLLEDVLGGGVAAALARTAALLREDLDALDALGRRRARPAGRRRRAARRRRSPACPTRCAGACCAAGCAAGGVPDLSRPSTCTPSMRCSSEWHGQGRVDLPGGAGVVRASGRLVLQPPTRRVAPPPDSEELHP